jgi:hydrogenase expression/formation protein HypE
MKNKPKSAPDFFYPPGKLPMEDLAGLLSRYSPPDPRLVVKPGIGRDACAISFGDRYLIAKTDPITFAAEEIGWYAVQVNANDIAAMGGTPRWFLAALLLPAGKTNPALVETIFAQISRACRDLGIILCGGHTEITLGLDRPIVVGQMLGEAEPGPLPTPERILPGDEILLTKGIAIEGTALIALEKKDLKKTFRGAFLRKCRTFLKNPGISVVREARIARRAGEVRAMHDPTEGGLATGLLEMARAAEVGLVVEREKVSIYPETGILCRELGLDPLGLLASGALLIAAPPEDAARIKKALRRDGIPVETIGRTWEKQKGIKILSGKEIRDLPVFPRDEIARFFEGPERFSPQSAQRSRRKKDHKNHS